jgi:NCS2 family nucleobase:cation symporter-2
MTVSDYPSTLGKTNSGEATAITGMHRGSAHEFRRYDEVPAAILLMTAAQHVLSLCAFLVFPILVGQAAGIDEAGIPALLSTTLIVMGVANFLQTYSRIGSGYLCPAGMTAAYLGPSLIAAKLGGLATVLGMTAFAGLIEVALSTVLHRLRQLAPAELIGTVILLVGIANAMTGFRTLVQRGSSEIAPNDLIIAGAAIGSMVVANLFAGSRAKFFCGLIGIVTGYLAAFATGTLELQRFAALRALPILALPPLPHLGMRFHSALIVPFAVVAFAATMKQVGFVSCAVRLQGDPDADVMTAARKGVLADGLGTVAAGLLGGLGVNASASSAGLILATKISSRRVGFVIAALLVLLGFQPHFAAALAIMPRGVIAAVLVFTSLFVLTNGMEMIVGAGISAEKTICVGLAVTGGLAFDLIPSLGASLPNILAPLGSSSFVAGTTIALLLNVLIALPRLWTKT